MTNGPDRIRILYVQHCSAVGGASWCLYEILRHLDRDRFAPHVILCEHGPLAARIQALGIPVTIEPNLVVFPVYERQGLAGQILGTINLIRSGSLYPKTFKRITDICRQLRPQIVHLNSLALMSWLWPVRKACEARIILHNREHWNPRGLLRLKNILKDRWVSVYADFVISITECGIRHFGHAGKSVVIRDWPSFDDEGFVDIKEAYTIDADKQVILVPGGMQNIKGSLDALRALPLMKMRDHVSVLILGCREIQPSWWKTMYTKLIPIGMYSYRMARQALREPHVRLARSTLRMKSHIEQSLLVVCPFRYPHAAKAALEAQRLGKPVLLYDSEETREYVRDGVTGRIIPVGNVRELACCADELTGDREKAEQMGREGKARMQLQFTREKAMQQLMGLYAGSRV